MSDQTTKFNWTWEYIPYNLAVPIESFLKQEQFKTNQVDFLFTKMGDFRRGKWIISHYALTIKVLTGEKEAEEYAKYLLNVLDHIEPNPLIDKRPVKKRTVVHKEGFFDWIEDFLP